MNALANSPFKDLRKFLCRGLPPGLPPVTFQRYTGQESDEQRQAIITNPPDILLTNYVMLELLPTRSHEKPIVRAARGLQFSVLDALRETAPGRDTLGISRNSYKGGNPMKNWICLTVILLTSLTMPTSAWGVYPQDLESSRWIVPSRPEQDAQVINPVSHLGGHTDAVDVAGSYAYIGAGKRLIVVDISAADRPVVSGQSAETTSNITALIVDGSYAYVTVGSDGLLILDISHPDHPVEVGSVDSPGFANGLAISGGHCYLSDGEGLRIVDVNDPANPEEVGFFDTPEASRGVQASSNSAYVISYFGLHVINVSDPTNPDELGFLSLDKNPNDIAMSGMYAYIATQGGGLSVIDVSNPYQPVEIGSEDMPGYGGKDAVVSGGLAYVGNYTPYGSYLRVVDVSDPFNPTEIGNLETPEPRDLALEGDHIYCAAAGRGLRIINVSTPHSPILLGTFNTDWQVRTVGVSGDVAYITDLTNGLDSIFFTVDITEPTQPVSLGSTTISGNVRDVLISGDYAYLANVGGVHIVDVSNPSAPEEKLAHATPGRAVGLFLDGTTLYVADDTEGLYILDVTDPLNPAFVGQMDTSGNANHVAVQGDYAFVADGDNGLRIADVSTPGSPQEIGFVSFEGYAKDVAVSGNFAYVADSDSGLRVMDVSDRYHPSEISALASGGGASRIVLQGNFIYYAIPYYGLSFIDVSDPYHPALARRYECDYAYDVEVVGDLAFLARGAYGFSILGFDGTNPGGPFEAGAYMIPVSATNVFIDQDHAFLADVSLIVVDVSDPENPLSLGWSETGLTEEDVFVRGDYAYVAVSHWPFHTGGLSVIDISDPYKPVEVGFYRSPGDSVDVKVLGDYAYLADLSGGLCTVNISDPANPTETACATSGDNAVRGVDVVGNLAYVTYGQYGFGIFDVSDPYNPIELGSEGMYTDYAYDVIVVDDYAYVANASLGLRVIDVGDPYHPDTISLFDPGYLATIDYQDGYIFTQAVDMIEVSNPFNPDLTAELHIEGGEGVQVAGEIIYCASGGLQILQVSEGVEPQLRVYLPLALRSE
jgi:hypothetical protein